ncbi:hypothetical protein ACJX0J_029988 [Zea mays]
MLDQSILICLHTTQVESSLRLCTFINIFMLKPIANRNAFLQIILDWIIPIHSHLAAYFDSAFTLFIIEFSITHTSAAGKYLIIIFGQRSEVSDNTLRILYDIIAAEII